MQKIKEYYRLTKPGIIYGNVLTTIAAFLFASRWHFSPWLLLTTVGGIGLVIASAGVFNNYFDREIDARMERTKNRALVTGAISVHKALLFGTVLGIVGILVLYFHTNALTAATALFGFISYVFIYGWAKRKGWWGALVGSVPGAVPIVVGYTAVTNHLDAAAVILFLILVTWQMPHFYSIAIYRLEEYKAAGIPVLPSVKGIPATKRHIIVYIILFILSISTLYVTGYEGGAYLVFALGASMAWLVRALRETTETDQLWAKSLFRFSLIVLLTFCVMLSVSPVLP